MIERGGERKQERDKRMEGSENGEGEREEEVMF